jgi:hypothetical protein
MMNPTQQSLELTGKQAHPQCNSCSKDKSSALALQFFIREDKGVQAEFACNRFCHGYPGFVHGGISFSLLASAAKGTWIA